MQNNSMVYEAKKSAVTAKTVGSMIGKGEPPMLKKKTVAKKTVAKKRKVAKKKAVPILRPVPPDNIRICKKK